MFKVEELNKFFPEIKSYAWTDPRWVPPGKTYTAKSVLNSAKYHLKKKMSGLKTEGFIVGAKKATGKGLDVHTMHTTQKAKKTGLLNWDDLAFGSAKENEAYAKGLDDVRSGFTTILENIANKHGGKNLDVVVETASSLRKDYGFPNKMKLKDYIERINKGLVELAAQTNGKVRGDILWVKGNNLKFIENKVGIDYSLVPGKGILKGNIKKYENLFKKIKMDAKGNVILDKNGMPAVKRGYTLSKKEAEDVLSVWLNIPSQMKAALKTKPFKGKLEFAEGGRTGFDAGSLVADEIQVKPNKAWEGIKKVGKYGIVRPIAGITLPGTQILPETVKAVKEKTLPDYDLTNPMTWMNAAFWNWAVKEWGFDKTADKFGQSLKHLSSGDKARVFRNVVARAGLSPNLVKFISSRIAWPMTGAMTYYQIQEFFKGKGRKTPLTEEEQKNIQKRKEAVPKMLNVYEQASQIAKDQNISYEEALKLINKPDVPGINFKDNYATGGIASLIK
jgi:hypothetical protein